MTNSVIREDAVSISKWFFLSKMWGSLVNFSSAKSFVPTLLGRNLIIWSWLDKNPPRKSPRFFLPHLCVCVWDWPLSSPTNISCDDQPSSSSSHKTGARYVSLPPPHGSVWPFLLELPSRSRSLHRKHVFQHSTLNRVQRVPSWKTGLVSTFFASSFQDAKREPDSTFFEKINSRDGDASWKKT